jgi:hypothetical protein
MSPMSYMFLRLLSLLRMSMSASDSNAVSSTMPVPVAANCDLGLRCTAPGCNKENGITFYWAIPVADTWVVVVGLS